MKRKHKLSPRLLYGQLDYFPILHVVNGITEVPYEEAMKGYKRKKRN